MTGMEAALASGVLKVAGDKLVSLIASEFASITGVKKHLCELEGKHQQITTWLAEVRDRTVGSGTPPQWVKELRNVAYDIDDLLYEVHQESEKHNRHRKGDKEPLANCFICAKSKSFLFRCKVARKIKSIKVKYDEIVKQAGDASTIRNNLQIDRPVRSSYRTAGELSMLSNVEDSKIPKRDQEKDEIIIKILEPNEGEDGHPMIVSIVGLGGSGKTTLAKHVCHDKKIKEHFQEDSRFWVHVSEEFDLRQLIGKLFQAITKQKYDLYAEEHMLGEISKKLCANKFLLVLDDAWHEERDDWEKFMVHLKSSASGSKIMLTTRNKKVAEIVKSKHICELKLLSEDESWSLFLKRSEWVEGDLSSEYIQVGKEILNRCGGVPLAIKILGGILCEKKEINFWRAIRDSDLWTNKSISDSVMASLRLSFIHLADELKQCFTFCSIFPNGCEIYKDRLIGQWVAHGFINAVNGVQPEDVGCDYFDSLVKIGFLHDPSVNSLSGQLAWKMHDLIHDLTRDILQDDIVTCLPDNMTTHSTHRCRYLSLTSCNEKVDRGSFDKVHALYIVGDIPSFDKLVRRSRSVRSVTLDYTTNAPFALFVMKFKYLGYLEIHNLHRKLLPEAISGCWNLQALILIYCIGFVTLPKSIGKLKKLRTLDLRRITDLESLPLSLGDCRDLRYLKLYSCQKLRMIPSSLGRNGSLKLLEIVNCGDLEQLPSEFIGEFSNLQTFSLAQCSYFQELPSKLSCPGLCILDLSNTKVTRLPQWVTTVGTLECVNLEGCKELVELPKVIGNLKRLTVLNIKNCRNLRSMPSGIGQLTRLRRLDLFVVGCGGDDARISELDNFDMLSGDLKITNLKYLKDPCDAEKACLKRKNRIQNLVLDWSPSETDEEMVLGIEQDLCVLNDLEPPSQIEKLEIKGYRASRLPWWLIEQNDSAYHEAKMLKQPSPCLFLSLTELTLSQFPHLKYLRGFLKFPSLKSLELSKMTNLEDLWTMTTGFEILEEDVRAQYCFPALSELHILDCPKLSAVKPFFPQSLEMLYLCKSNSQLLSPGNFSHPLPPPANESSSSCSLHSAVPHLKTLKLVKRMTGSSPGWEFLKHHTELETLSIIHFDDLTELPDSIRSLTSLQRLEISSCSTLGTLPDWLGELCSLRDLDVSYTPEIASLPQSIGYLTSLTRLRIFRLDNLKMLPDAIQDLASLESLELTFRCGALTVLPECMGQLSALRYLWIHGCPALQCLPQSIQSLASLQSLVISQCPALARRCNKRVGPDWHLVSHIPCVTIF